MSYTDGKTQTLKLPCRIRPLPPSRGEGTTGFTKDLTRDAVIVLLPGLREWLNPVAEVVVTIDLPFHGDFSPRMLECRARVTRIVRRRKTLEVHARIHRMSIAERFAPPARQERLEDSCGETTGGRGRKAAKTATRNTSIH